MVFNQFFADERKDVTGIDLGGSAIKMVTLRPDGKGGAEIVRASSYAFKRGEMNLKDSEQRSRLVAALKEAKDQHGVPPGAVVIGLPRERTTLRYVDLPSTTPAEIKEMLMFDVERHVPIPVDQMEINHTIVEQREDSSTVLLIAAPLEEVRELISVYGEAGIQVDVVDVDVLATCAGYALDEEDTTSVRAVLDIGLSKSDLGVLSGDTLRFSRSFPLGEEQLRHWSGVGAEDELPVQPPAKWVDLMAADLKRLFHAYECRPDVEPIREVVICGGLSRLEGLESELARRLNRRVKVCPPELSGIGGVDGAQAQEMTVALGLALRNRLQPEVNLLPRSEIESRHAAESRRMVRNIGVMAALVLILAGLVIGAKFQAKFQHRDNIQAALAQIEPKIRDIKRKKAELDEIQRNIDSENSFYKVMRDLYMRTPENIQYTNISFEKKKSLSLKGRALTDPEVFNLRNVLIESPHFKDVILESAGWDTLFKIPVRRFDMTCILSSNEEYRQKRR
jgi:type IV pilus assembly protein PilM